MPDRTAVLVDDNHTVLGGMSELLQQHGIQVAAFTDFPSARQYLQTHSARALVTDVRLGAFNGLHLVLLSKQWSPDIAAFVYSTHGDSALREEVQRVGAVYVAKDDIVELLMPKLLRALGAEARVPDARTA